MLIRKPVLEKIVAGEVTLAFRRWKRPTVRSGGRLRTAVGELAIHDVSIVAPESLTADDARAAGHASLDALRKELAGEGEIYRISLSYAGADGRAALREETEFDEAQLATLHGKLRRIDERLERPGWTRNTLRLIGENPGRRAQELADLLGMEKAAFKTEVRRLKELGLTESLETGYRLSPRGWKVLEGA
ncbi:hypothetical protein [Rhizobium sp. LC145]|uniref:hypothetical protein n=1 Tax=Rhizobium sp. LC145 TaxID=1120688 RepID=UPI00062A12D6|nr:hypothetical protein [Rhizobium sp. LC145]KKX28099.1 hypothetical protein YH62_18500 [Rhizobium sp. LC145]TKT54444.1 hypothetical protein FDR95_20095 [Rhizobiaceae bacterium LC148]